MTYEETYEQKITTHKKQLFSNEHTLKVSASILVGSAVSPSKATIDTSFMGRFFSETSMDKKTELLHKTKFSVKVGPKQTAKMYQIKVQCNGMPDYRGGITDSTEELPVVYMVINKGVVLCLIQLFDCLKTIKPDRDNKKEWEAIRELILSLEDSSNDQHKFKRIVEQLGNTKPLHDNKKEWASIRNTCSEILSVINGRPSHDDYNLQMKKLLARLQTITPKHDNKREWAEIRKETSALYEIISQFAK